MTVSFIPTQRTTNHEDGECLHGMTPAWCGICKGMVARSMYATPSGRTHADGPSKQDLLDKVCSLLAIPSVRIGEGSSLPSTVFRAAARLTDVPTGSMPEIGQRIAAKAGLVWGTDCDSRDTTSAGGSTVTREGLDVLVNALETLATRVACTECGTNVTRDEHIDNLCFNCVDALTAVAA